MRKLLVIACLVACEPGREPASTSDSPVAADSAALDAFLRTHQVELRNDQKDTFLMLCELSRLPIVSGRQAGRATNVPEVVNGKPLPKALRDRLLARSQEEVDGILWASAFNFEQLQSVADESHSPKDLLLLYVQFAVRCFPNGKPAS
ncbi:MAG: hypothetical protein JWP01_3194 [Myxococcales bacterium]|nr:hypothetical protein [Myxococcales bacterium]